MSNSLIRCLVIAVGVLFILIFAVTLTVYFILRPTGPSTVSDSCPRPKQYAKDYDFDYTSKSKEYRNANGTTDYFRLSLSWSPTFCASRKKHAEQPFQCQHAFGLIVHGLWPNARKDNNTGHGSQSVRAHPRNCRNEPAIPIEVIQKYFCLMPSEMLMQGEWEKHGTCYWSTPEAYFERIASLYSKVRIPNNIQEILDNRTISKRDRRGAIRDAFLQLNPGMKADEIDIMMVNRGRRLKEVAFCYDLNFNHIQCYFGH